MTNFVGENYDGWELADLLKEKLVGHRIAEITDEKIVLDDGTVLSISPNEGCGGCSSGWAEFEVNFTKSINKEAAVMNVKYEDSSTNKEKNYADDEFKIFIYLVNDELIEIDGCEGYGNGCYGSGFWVTVTK